MKERITVLFPINILAVAGAEQQLLELVQGLNKKRFKPIVLTLTSGGPLEKEFQAIPGVELISLERKGKYDFWCLFNILRILIERKVDIVQPYLTPANLFSLLPAFLCRTPVKIMTRRPGIPSKQASMGYRLYFRAEAFLGRYVDWVVANSQAGKQYMLGKGVREDHIKIIPNGLNLKKLLDDSLPMAEARRRLGLPTDSKIVGTMARLAPSKGHSVLLRAAVEVQSVFPSVKFCLVGDGPLRGSLERLTHDLGLSSAVIFCGEQRNIGTYISAFDIAALSSYEEGLSMFILEAMALGKPIVASDLIGNRDAVRNHDTGLLVPPADDKALAEAIIGLLRDTKTAKAMGRRAKREASTNFDLETMINRYMSLYEETLLDKGNKRK